MYSGKAQVVVILLPAFIMNITISYCIPDYIGKLVKRHLSSCVHNIAERQTLIEFHFILNAK